MRIGLVIYGSPDTLSGGYLYDRKLVEYLRGEEDTVEIISLPWRNYAAHLADNLWFRLWSPEASPWRRGDTRIWQFRQQAAGLQRYDILIQDELNHPSLLLANRGKHPYPIISLVHHLRCSELRPRWQNAFYRLIERTYLRSVDGFIFNSQATERAVNSLLRDRKPSLLAYPPTEQFGEPISEDEIVGRAQTYPLRILFLGNVIKRKGLHTLLEAVSGRRPAFSLDIVGSLSFEPAYVRQVQELITRHNLSSFVFFHGALDKEQLAQKLRQVHVLVVPSSYEGFGIVYLEGMCFGLPAVGTTAGAASEVITDERDGFLIGHGDIDLLASRLMQLNENRDLLLEMSLAARRRYLRQPKWLETARRIREFLQSFLGTID